MIKAMVDGGEIKGTVNEIRNTYDRRNAVEDVAAVKGADLDITKEGGQTVIRAEWSKKLPLAGNISICADFSVSSAP
jgi:hypothetical protein